MARKFDRIVLVVPDLQAAVQQYQLLFGTAPFTYKNFRGESAACWDLTNTVMELAQSTVDKPRIQGIVFNSLEAAQGESPVANSMGIDIRLCDGHPTADFRRLRPEGQCAALSVDHVVLRTDDANACIELFSGELGIRLALDKKAPEWGGRMVFFRTGKLTLEVIESDIDTSGGNFFWGLAYQCQDLADLAGKLGERGVAVSGIREGRKPGTLVATLKSHCLDIPTLLIQPAI